MIIRIYEELINTFDSWELVNPYNHWNERTDSLNYEPETISDRFYTACLISLVIKGYDIMLRMDWLAQYYV